jgi:hypothetical protein
VQHAISRHALRLRDEESPPAGVPIEEPVRNALPDRVELDALDDLAALAALDPV